MIDRLEFEPLQTSDHGIQGNSTPVRVREPKLNREQAPVATLPDGSTPSGGATCKAHRVPNL